MAQNHAKFMAEIAKGINIKESNVELKLLIPLKDAQKHLIFLSSNQGEPVHVFLGDPQVSFNFSDEEEDAMYQKVTGRYVTTDSSGVVTKVEKPDNQEDDENQQTLFGQDLEQKGDSAGEQEGDTPAGGDGVDVPGQEESDPGLSEDLPDWMTGGDDAGGEIDFTDSGSGQEPDDPEDELTDYKREIMGESEAEISKEALEEYIISQAPTFEDIPFDFPTLLKQRKEESKTWMQIAKEAGVPSSQISSKYSLYKKRVEKLMRGGGVA
ncbi:hypothetical protein [Paenibacillus macerans]|uniref:hypothetical protein n=1 Tax=Paenibacillus macerans TaxID=44252 RepID=UPI002041C108|nr:hypothetical protein [Paenibacillus macerans]MCM3699221.1 hypothetical protein [Paenibacillus macerans]